MYRLTSIDEAVMTRFVELQNLETNTKDRCFDYSAVMSDEKNFEFMELGGVYDCKIELFGDFVEAAGEDVAELKIVGDIINVGNTEFVKVMIGEDEYYILNSELEELPAGRKPLYQFTRKDLIQVDDVVHGDLL